jgi:hypothetical protein
MKVEILPTEVVNNCQAGYNDFRVVIDGKFWGWVSGPSKGERYGRKTAWRALKGEIRDGQELAVPFVYWESGHPNAHAAILAAL